MLQLFVVPQIQDIPDLIFQQDGAPPYWGGLDVRACLDTAFLGRWIARGGLINWPPRSPDITPLDVFLWGYVKDEVYQTLVNDIAALWRRITDVITSIPHDMLTNTWVELEYRLDILLAMKGAHIEIY
ncbi:uncharacterized protein LOC111622568 [Centruroides sculpturatus]|uniref:uncharacterized protein LOC111622568 n=1 Tax=Centruroides sculpturatus TaxID=218467 RepID=UPI000C6C9545|nr:uncharacterized protein LOC111622568 [Centruroides sculpturatus]